MKWDWSAFLIGSFLGIIIGLLVIGSAHSRELYQGQWDEQNPGLAEWYRNLKQPDNPNTSCCGEADAYYCDDIHVKNGATFCTITDDRVVPRRPDRNGEVIEIPDRKLKWDQGNPTGHAIVFLSSGGAVYCFVQGVLI